MVTVTKGIKDATFERNKDFIDIIYSINSGMILHSQLIVLCEEMGLGTTTMIKRSILELIKADLVRKKQVLNTNNNMLILTAHPIARIEGISSADAYLPQDSIKSILGSLLRTEQKINTIKFFKKRYNIRGSLSVEQVKEIFSKLNSTMCVPLRDINEYLESLNRKYADFLSQDFRDELTCLQVSKALKINSLAVYNSVEIDPEALKIKETYDSYKSMYRGSEVQQNFFNFSGIKNSSCDIEQFSIANGRIELRLAIFQTRNGNLDRACEIAAWTYLALKRYNNLDEDPMLFVRVYLIDEETTEQYIEESERLAEFNYGLRGATKITEKLKLCGVRFPQCTDCIDFKFKNLHITDHYHISF